MAEDTEDGIEKALLIDKKISREMDRKREHKEHDVEKRLQFSRRAGSRLRDIVRTDCW